MRILGIDPGSRITGYGVIDTDGRHSTCLGSGCVRTPQGALTERLGRIFDEIDSIVGHYRPDALAIEQVFVSRNPASALKLGQARGAAICAVVRHGLPVSEYSPRTVKQALVGRGSADKAQVQHMVCRILSLTDTPAVDATDALGIALCHAHTHTTRTRVLSAARGLRR